MIKYTRKNRDGRIHYEAEVSGHIKGVYFDKARIAKQSDNRWNLLVNNEDDSLGGYFPVITGFTTLKIAKEELEFSSVAA